MIDQKDKEKIEELTKQVEELKKAVNILMQKEEQRDKNSLSQELLDSEDIYEVINTFLNILKGIEEGVKDINNIMETRFMWGR